MRRKKKKKKQRKKEKERYIHVKHVANKKEKEKTNFSKVLDRNQGVLLVIKLQ